MIASRLKASLQDLSECKQLYLGFSAGLDSSVLLHLLSQESLLFAKTKAIHVHHGISKNADAWANLAKEICQAYQLPLIVRKVRLKSSANLEEEARKARYAVFKSILEEGDALLLAHHQDDQAETLLLQLFRGAGIGGMAAMPSTKSFCKARLVRPLLTLSRLDLEAYAKQNQLQFVQDESNQDLAFSRNFLRHAVLPEIETRWRGVKKNLARTAAICAETEGLLKNLAEIDYQEHLEGNHPLKIAQLKGLSVSRMNNVIRQWLKTQVSTMPSSVVFESILKEVIGAEQDKCPDLSWGNYCLKRYQESLYVLKDWDAGELSELPWPDFPRPLPLPANLGFLKVAMEAKAENALFVPEGAVMSIKFRQGGEHFVFHGQSKRLKKLLQEWQVPPWMRSRLPLLFIDGELALVVGHAISDTFYAGNQKWQGAKGTRCQVLQQTSDTNSLKF